MAWPAAPPEDSHRPPGSRQAGAGHPGAGPGQLRLPWPEFEARAHHLHAGPLRKCCLNKQFQRTGVFSWGRGGGSLVPAPPTNSTSN